MLLRFLWIFVFPTMAFSQATLDRQVIHATQKGGRVLFQGRTIKTEELSTAIRKARPGDRVLILPGRYTGTLKISKEGEANDPVYIQGVDGLSVFDCNDKLASEGQPALHIQSSQNLHFSGLKIQNCFPQAVMVTDSRFIKFEDMVIDHSTVAYELQCRGTHHIWIKANQWLHPSGADHAFVRSTKTDGRIFLENNMSEGRLFRHVANIEDPVFEGLYAFQNQIKDPRYEIFGFQGRVSDVWLSDNEMMGSGLVATANPLSRLTLLNNQLEFSDAGLNGSFDRSVIVHNEIKGSKKLLGSEGRVDIVANRFISAEMISDELCQPQKARFYANEAVDPQQHAILKKCQSRPSTFVSQIKDWGWRYYGSDRTWLPGRMNLTTWTEGPWPRELVVSPGIESILMQTFSKGGKSYFLNDAKPWIKIEAATALNGEKQSECIVKDHLVCGIDSGVDELRIKSKKLTLRSFFQPRIFPLDEGRRLFEKSSPKLP